MEKWVHTMHIGNVHCSLSATACWYISFILACFPINNRDRILCISCFRSSRRSSRDCEWPDSNLLLMSSMFARQIGRSRCASFARSRSMSSQSSSNISSSPESSATARSSVYPMSMPLALNLQTTRIHQIKFCSNTEEWRYYTWPVWTAPLSHVWKHALRDRVIAAILPSSRVQISCSVLLRSTAEVRSVLDRFYLKSVRRPAEVLLVGFHGLSIRAYVECLTIQNKCIIK